LSDLTNVNVSKISKILTYLSITQVLKIINIFELTINFNFFAVTSGVLP